jgi:hypothetical protein
MSISASEIEIIVRRVLSSLLASDPTVVQQSASSVLVIDDAVVTVQSLANRLKGMSSLQVRHNAVVTPAVRDLCRESKVTIIKSGPNASSQSSIQSAPLVGDTPNAATSNRFPTTAASQPLLIAGSAPWLVGMAKQLCPKQALVSERAVDDASALREIATGIRNGHRVGLLIANAPHATCWQAARDDRLRPAVLSQWNDIAHVLAELPVNTIILSSSKWNIPSACNVARHVFEHLQRHN